MQVIDGEAVAGCQVKTPAHPVDLHVAVDLAALCERVFQPFGRLVVFTLYKIRGVADCPLSEPVGFLDLVTSITASRNHND